MFIKYKLVIRKLIFYTSIILVSYIAIICLPSKANAASNIGISTGGIISFFQDFELPLPSVRQRFIGDIVKTFETIEEAFTYLMKGDRETFIMVLSAFIPFVLILMLIKKFQSNLKQKTTSRTRQMSRMLRVAKKEVDRLDD